MAVVVRLKGGKGSKAKYNGKLFKITQNRLRGGWVAGHLLDHPQHKHIELKWRNTAWTLVKKQPETRKQQQYESTGLKDLPDEILVKTLSFLGGTKDFFKAIHSVSFACKTLQRRVRNIPLTANLCGFERQAQHFALKTICTCRCKLEGLSLVIGEKDNTLLRDVLSSPLLDCSELKKLEIYTRRDTAYQYLCPDILNGEKHVMTQLMRETKQLPQLCKSFDSSRLLMFLSRFCPNLHTVRAQIDLSFVGKQEWRTISHFFRSPHLRNIHFTLAPTNRVDTCRNLDPRRVIFEFAELISSIPNLDNFSLSGWYKFGGYPKPWIKNLEIRSNSVKRIDVSHMAESTFFSQVVCPKLEYFRCRASLLGNGVRPLRDQRAWDNSAFHIPPITTTAKEGNFFGMDVPGSCVVEVAG